MTIDKIIIVSNYVPPRNSGAGQRAYNHAKYFKKLGYNVSLIVQYPFGSNLLEFQKRNDIHDGLDKHDILELSYGFELENSEGLSKLIKTFILIPKLLIELIKKIKSDQNKKIVVHGFSTSLLVYLTIFVSLLKFKKIASFIEITSLYPPGFKFYDKSGLKNNIFKFIYCKLLSIPSKIITLSPANNDNYNVFMGSNSNSKLITNGIDIKKFFKENPQNRDKIRKKLNLPIETPIIVYVGSVHPYKKRVDVFLELINSMSKHENKVTACFLFIGNNDRTKTHRKLTAKLIEIADKSSNINVLFTGHVENVSMYLKCSDIYILPSEAEGLPNSVIEAMACGLPVIMNKINGISDFILTHGKNGYIINDNKISDYITIINKLLTSPKEYSKISQNALNCIEERFTDEIVNQKYLNIYSNILNKPQ
jgi:glycosyltransferase involved in cell wall biosynthesis